MGRLKYLRSVFTICLLAHASLAWADMDIEQIRRLVEQKQVLPLQQVLAVVESEMAGRAIEVELESKDDGFIYEIEWLDQQGRVWEFKLDADSGEILEHELD